MGGGGCQKNNIFFLQTTERKLKEHFPQETNQQLTREMWSCNWSKKVNKTNI